MAISDKVKIPNKVCIIKDFKSSKSDMIDYDENINLSHFDNTPTNIQISTDTITNKTKIVDPRGFSCYVNNEDIIKLMMETTIVNGIIKDKCVWVIDQRFRTYPVVYNGDTYNKIIETINKTTSLNNELVSFNEIGLFSSVSRPKDKYQFYDKKRLTYIGQFSCKSQFNLAVECTNTFNNVSTFEHAIEGLMYDYSYYNPNITVTFNDITRNTKNKTLKIYRINKLNEHVIKQFMLVFKNHPIVNCTFTLVIDYLMLDSNKSFYFYNEISKSVTCGYESYSNSKSFLVHNDKVSVNANNIDTIMYNYYMSLTKQKNLRSSNDIINYFIRNIYRHNSKDTPNYYVLKDCLDIKVVNHILKNNFRKFLRD